MKLLGPRAGSSLRGPVKKPMVVLLTPTSGIKPLRAFLNSRLFAVSSSEELMTRPTSWDVGP